MRVLVAGGAGYIGSFVVKLLVARGHEVRVFDNLSTGRRAAVGDVAIDVGDVRSAELVAAKTRAFQPEAVIHLVGLKSVAESVRSPGIYYDVNVQGTKNLLQAAIECGVRRFVFSSSCSVYGTPHVCPVDERAATRPLSPYGETKLAAERMVRWFAQAGGMLHTSLRYFNVAGAAADCSLGEFRLEESVQIIPSTIRAALRGESIDVNGDDYPTEDGTAVRDYIHVEDLADAHVRILKSMTPETNGVYNLGNGEPSSVESIVRQVELASGRQIGRRLQPRRAGDAAICWADASLARDTFQWKPERGLAEIVRSEWEWHRSRFRSEV